MSAQNMVLQVESLPELIRSEFRELDRRVRLLLDHNEWLSVKKVVLTGCGDSYMAGIAAELYLGAAGMKAQMKYADRRRSPPGTSSSLARASSAKAWLT